LLFQKKKAVAAPSRNLSVASSLDVDEARTRLGTNSLDAAAEAALDVGDAWDDDDDLDFD
jgi:hypothetical protein